MRIIQRHSVQLEIAVLFRRYFNSEYKPYRGSNNKPTYNINKKPNHPLNISRQLPKFITREVSDTLSSKDIFDKSISIVRMWFQRGVEVNAQRHNSSRRKKFKEQEGET